jgi:ATP-dependent helicase/nuclease subunit B
LAPSIFWRKLRQLMPDVAIAQAPRLDRLPATAIATPRRLVTALMQWARSQKHIDASEKSRPAYAGAPRLPKAAENPAADAKRSVNTVPAPAADAEQRTLAHLYQWLARRPAAADKSDVETESDTRADDPIDAMRFGAWKALSATNDARLSAHVSRRLFAPPLHTTAAELESFRNCPFQHFARYGLRLEQRADDQITGADLSQAYHEILDRLLLRLQSAQRSWIDATPDEIDAMVRQIAEDVGRSLRGELMLSSARNQYLLKRIEKTLASVVAAQKAAHGRGYFRPKFSNVGFGRGEGRKLPALHVFTPRGHECYVQGKIDRVDLIDAAAKPGSANQAKNGATVGDAGAVTPGAAPSGVTRAGAATGVSGAAGPIAAAAIDYRMSADKLSLDEVYHGLSLRLPIYLLALADGGFNLAQAPLAPAAAFSVQLPRHVADGDPNAAIGPDDPRFHLLIKPRGIFDFDAIRALDSELRNGQTSEVVSARVNKDGRPGRSSGGDAATGEELAALLEHVRRTIGELADGILAGVIAVAPYRLNKQSPCARCEFKDVCRFDPQVDHYDHLAPMKREQVLAKVVEASRSVPPRRGEVSAR